MAICNACRFWVGGLLLTACGHNVCAQEKPPTAPRSLEQSNPELKRLDNEIHKMDQELRSIRYSADAPPDWKALVEVESKLNAAKLNHAKEVAPLQNRSRQLSKSDGVAEWQARIDKLSEQRKKLEVDSDRLTRTTGAQLFEKRHAELAKKFPLATPQLRALGLDLLNYPRIDGSTSTQPLAILMTCQCFGASVAWEGEGQRSPSKDDLSDIERFFLVNTRPEPESTLLEFTLKARADQIADERLAIIINRLLATNASTHQAYVNLIEGRSEIGLLARRPSPEELQLASSHNVELEVIVCALDAFVFLVNQDNPIDNLTTNQIRGIYSGRIKNWSNVGGEFGQITAYQREEASGSQQLMRELVMKETPLEEHDGPFRAKSPQLIGYLMSSPYLQLTRDKLGLGFSVYYYERYMSGSPRTKTIAVDGVEVKPDTIASRKYPYVSEVFVVTRKGLGRDVPAARLRDWLLSSEGQLVVKASGYVPVAGAR